jgi:phage terminase small subunit
MTESKLTPRQRRFVEAYLEIWNASEAARMAGYKARADMAGPRLMRNDGIRAMIKARMAETSMQADEALKRLTAQAQLNAATFFNFEIVDDKLVMEGINWEVVKTYGHLVKKISYSRQGKVMLEFHDAQKALELIGRAYGLFNDKASDINIQVNIDDWRGKRQERLEQVENLDTEATTDEADNGESPVCG